jgi:hypothetical protein
MATGSIGPESADPSYSLLYPIIGLKFKRNFLMTRTNCSSFQRIEPQGQ